MGSILIRRPVLLYAAGDDHRWKGQGALVPQSVVECVV